MLDPAWREGRYEHGHGPDAGLQIARMVGMQTYQSAAGQWRRFGREPASRPTSASPLGEKFDIEGYLEYQGRSLARRFDANSYLYLTRAMDLYDVADGWASEETALKRIRARTLHVGMSTDWLYPVEHVRALVEKLRAVGNNATYTELTSVHGHDAFLKEWLDLERIIRRYLDKARTPHLADDKGQPATTPAQAS